MEVKISNNAVEFLKSKIKEKGSNLGARIYIAGIGWGGPSFGLTLDEPKEKDTVIQENGIKFIFDNELSGYAKGFDIDYIKSFFGKKLVVSQLYNNSSCI